MEASGEKMMVQVEVEVEVEEVGDGGGRSSSRNGDAAGGYPSLAVSKASSKIGKGMRTKPPLLPKPVAPPRVYNTNPTSFRNLVQELTGTAHNSPAMAASSFASSSKPAHNNTRLQKVAPPPLKTQPMSSFSPTATTSATESSNSAVKMLSPIPILSPHTFSPLPAFASSSSSSSSDCMWPNPLDSPNTAELRFLAKKMVEHEKASSCLSANADLSSSFAWSPAIQSCLGLGSPVFGMASGPQGLGHIYATFALSDSPSPRSINDFMFPEPDYVSGFS